MLLTDISYFHKHQKGQARVDDLSASLWLFPAQPETYKTMTVDVTHHYSKNIVFCNTNCVV